MRILVVSLILPWPQDEGARMRAGQTVQALCEVADVDLYCVVGAVKAAALPEQPADLPLRRVRVAARPGVRWWSRAGWFRPGAPPRMVAGWNRRLEGDLNAWTDPPYDLVWIIRAAPAAAVGVPTFAPVVVDLDDLEDQKASERAEVTSGLQSIGLRLDAARWRRWQSDLAGRASAVLVCSEDDRRRVPTPNAVVVSNGYEPVEEPHRSAEQQDPPSILLQGDLMRPPLIDAANILAREVLPRVHRELPDTRLDLVGSAGERVLGLDAPPFVRVHGHVPSMAPFLETAGLVAVPMRWGSGTRIKILEAFAHRIPVVSSTIGAEGLDVEDGRHLVIADDPDSFADACLRVLRDPDGSRRMVDDAFELYRTRYRWGPIRASIGDLARQVADRVPVADR